ncbi:ABC transporter permease [uncultured Hoeflea sp.]|jgi:ribose transport system permease protein|uniref:ABC transporter permease n=1 Tax=uncultured Hoeflea sp. TaxID=538666 RepID=UPI0030D8A265|tara:strand:+ start:586 stop:1578 length:993 start_codon:yes stop_codon:yes gene_type:complete
MQKKDIGLATLVVTVGAIVAMVNPRFLSPINLANTANLIGLFGLFSIAEAFVIVTAGIELSIGSVIALIGVIFVDLIASFGVPWPIALAIVMVLSVFIGLLHGWLITRLKLQPFVVTLCGLLIYRGVARFYTKDGTAGFTFGSDFPMLEFLVSGRTGGVPHSVVAFGLVAIIAWFLLHRTVFGRHLFAVGKNVEAARYSGINTDRVIIQAYVLCAFLTGISAVFFAMYTRSVQPSSHGNFYELYGIAAAVLGGFSLRGGEGSIVGVVLGVILLQILQNLVNLLGIPSSLNFAVMGSVILAGVIADTQFSRYREVRRQQIAMSALEDSAKR